MNKNYAIFILLFLSGLIICLTNAVLLFLGIISSGLSVVTGIVGIGLIGCSGAYKAGTSNEGVIKK